MTEPLTPARRLRAVAAGLGILAGGAVATFGVIVWDEAVRPPNAFGGGITTMFLPLVIPGTVAGFFWALGAAVMPRRIFEAGARTPFCAGAALTGLAVLFALPSMLWVLTLPLAIVCGIGAALQFRAARRRLAGRPSSAQPPAA